MPVVHLQPLPGYEGYYEMTAIGSGSAPPRPTPPGYIPGLRPEHPIYLPPYPSHPIYYPPGFGPDDPRPTHPIMLPGMPGWGQPAPQPPETPGPGTNALVIPMPPPPAGQPAPVPPAGLPPDSVQVLIWFGPGTKPAIAWVAPFASTGPVPAQPQKK